MRGNQQAINETEERGIELFKNKARCIQCHNGFNFTDEKYHNIGIDWDSTSVDLGRYIVTKKVEDIGAFKTPTLREIARTAPYMHNGSLATLEETVEFYNRGGIANPFLDVEMQRSTRTLEQVLKYYEKKRDDRDGPRSEKRITQAESHKAGKRRSGEFLESVERPRVAAYQSAGVFSGIIGSHVTAN